MPLHSLVARLVRIGAAALVLAVVLAVCWNRRGPEASAAAGQVGVRDESSRGGVPVLVELFTSEGCSSCPPADALLSSLYRDQPVAGADIIILEEHVDYWDRLGWKDRFSSPEVTARQREYGTQFRLDDIYTPQMVVNGVTQLNGSDGGGARRTISREAGAGHAVRLRFGSVAVHGSRVAFQLAAGTFLPKGSSLYAALVDPEASTTVRAGENGGKTLHHAGVVRWLGQVGNPHDGKEQGTQGFEFEPKMEGEKDLGGKRLVVFAQQTKVGPVTAIASCTMGTAGGSGNSQSSPPSNRCPSPSI